MSAEPDAAPAEPAAPAERIPAYGKELRQRILSGFRGTVPTIKPSLGYRVALAGAACTMVLMPFVYAALVGGVVWAIWWYFARIDYASVSTSVSAEVGLALLPVWILPPVLAVMVLICLVKPLFFRSRRREGEMLLDPARERLVFELVGRVCAALQAPVPREIRINCDVNAYAGFRRGLRSMLSDDMALVIGLPLVEGLTLQQLAGVIAHEMGHFSQKAGLRLTTLVRTMNGWLLRLVYKRDGFDEMIENSTRSTQVLAVRAVLLYTRFLIGLGRKILWLAMVGGHAVSAYVMRHLEYDADRYEVRLAGFGSFDSTMREMVAMGAAHEMAIEQLAKQWRERRLVDNLPRLVMSNRRTRAKEIGAALETFLAGEEEGLFSSHPPARLRIQRALQEKGVGVFSSDLPASALFADLEKLEKAATLHFYRSVLGNRVRQADLVPVQDLRERQQRSDDEQTVRARYFPNYYHHRPLPLPARIPEASESREATVQRLEETRRTVEEAAAGHAKTLAEYRKTLEARFSALRAAALLEVGYTIQASSFKLPRGDRATALRAAEQLQQKAAGLAAALAVHEASQVRRLETALALMSLPEAAGKLAEAPASPGEVERLLACGVCLAEQAPARHALRESYRSLEILTLQLNPEEEPPPELLSEIGRRLEGFREQLKDLHRSLRAQAYPFEHGRPDTTLAQDILPTMPAGDDPVGHFAVAEAAVSRIAQLEARLLGRLAWIAERVEAGLGMKPLEIDVEDDAADPREAAALKQGPMEPGAVSAPVPATTPLRTRPASEEKAPAVGPAEEAPEDADDADDAEPVEVPAWIARMRRLSESKADVVESRETFARFLRNPLELRAIPLPDQAPARPDDPQAATEVLWEALLALKKELEENGRRVLQYRGAEQRWIKAVQAEELLNAGLTLRAEDFGLVAGNLANAARLRERSAEQMEAVEPALAAVEAIQGRRLAQALALLAEPQVAARLEGAVRPEEVEPLFAATVGLHRSFPALRELRRRQLLLGILMAQGPAARLKRPFAERLSAQMTAAHRQLRRLRRGLHAEPYPFDHPYESCQTLAQKMIPLLPGGDDHAAIHSAVLLALREAADLQRRTLGRLAGLAERVEHTLGLGLD